MNRLTVLMGSVVLLLGVATAVYVDGLKPSKQLPMLDSLGGEFSLPTTLGVDKKLSDFRGQVVIVNFGFTSCPDVCPTMLAFMRKVLEQPELKGAAIQPLFITIDPERDTAEVLKPYLAYFYPSLIGMTGSVEAVAEVAALFKVYSKKEAVEAAADTESEENNYSFSHSGHLYLLDKQGVVRATYGTSRPIEEIAADVRSLL